MTDKKRHERFATWVEEQVANDDLVAAARKRALAGSDRLSMFLLRVRRPEIYDRRRAFSNGSVATIKISFNGKARSMTSADDLTDEQLDKMILGQVEDAGDASALYVAEDVDEFDGDLK